MNEIERITDQMERIHVGNPWTDRPFSRLLEGVTHIQAAAKPLEDGHSIWEIVLHLITAQELIVDLVRDEMRPFEPGDEWPSVADESDAAWQETLDRFFAGDEEVRETVAFGVPEDVLDEPFQEGGSAAYNNLHGYVQHAVYHGGQISMLKRLTESETV